MEDKIKFSTRITTINNTNYLKIPKELAEYLNLKHEDEMIAVADKKKKGQFLAAWKKQ
jgi:bifunctional DNA-binding transcriptional regulator/antitoxin component of YhaV-PrlF toxin-antitoxin module